MFRGRYGVDRLNRTLLIVAVLLSLVTMFLGSVPVLRRIFTGVSTLLLILTIFRMFSRNIAARQNELYRYMNFENRIRAWWGRVRGSCNRSRSEFKDRKHYKYLSCPQCMQKLRVPRGKGRLRVTCTRCGNKFETKS